MTRPQAVLVAETDSVQVLSSDGVTYYTVRDGVCDCPAGKHGHSCRHLPIARDFLQSLVDAATEEGTAAEVDPFARLNARKRAVEGFRQRATTDIRANHLYALHAIDSER